MPGLVGALSGETGTGESCPSLGPRAAASVENSWEIEIPFTSETHRGRMGNSATVVCACVYVCAPETDPSLLGSSVSLPLNRLTDPLPNF